LSAWTRRCAHTRTRTRTHTHMCACMHTSRCWTRPLRRHWRWQASGWVPWCAVVCADRLHVSAHSYCVHQLSPPMEAVLQAGFLCIPWQGEERKGSAQAMKTLRASLVICCARTLSQSRQNRHALSKLGCRLRGGEQERERASLRSRQLRTSLQSARSEEAWKSKVATMQAQLSTLKDQIFATQEASNGVGGGTWWSSGQVRVCCGPSIPNAGGAGQRQLKVPVDAAHYVCEILVGLPVLTNSERKQCRAPLLGADGPIAGACTLNLSPLIKGKGRNFALRARVMSTIGLLPAPQQLGPPKCGGKAHACTPTVLTCCDRCFMRTAHYYHPNLSAEGADCAGATG